jgi:hypothetical protein
MILVIVTKDSGEIQNPIYKELNGSEYLIDFIQEALGYEKDHSDGLPYLEFDEWMEVNELEVKSIDLINPGSDCIHFAVENIFDHGNNIPFWKIITSEPGDIISQYFTLK